METRQAVTYSTFFKTTYDSAYAAFFVSLTQHFSADIMKKLGCNDEAIYSAAELLRGAILWQLGRHPVRIAATPILYLYFYSAFKDDRKYRGEDTDPTADSIANGLTTGVLLIYDIVTDPANLSQAILINSASVAANLSTKITVSGLYQWVKSLFAGDREVVQRPRERAWLSLSF